MIVQHTGGYTPLRGEQVGAQKVRHLAPIGVWGEVAHHFPRQPRLATIKSPNPRELVP